MTKIENISKRERDRERERERRTESIDTPPSIEPIHRLKR